MGAAYVRFAVANPTHLPMLAIDGELGGLGTIEQLMQYAFDRLRTGIAAHVGVDLAPARSTSG